MSTIYPVCRKHLKWAPCLVKSDHEADCVVVSNNDYAEDVIKRFHAGRLTRTEAEEMLV
jgi:hypothetical protein